MGGGFLVRKMMESDAGWFARENVILLCYVAKWVEIIHLASILCVDLILVAEVSTIKMLQVEGCC